MRAGPLLRARCQNSKSFPSKSFSKPAAACFVLAGLGFAGCAQQPQQQFAHSKEYFPSSVYGRASDRVVADGEPVPRGGGQYLVGKPYTVAGQTYYPAEKKHYAATGLASWYGDAFHGRRTANGEVYDRDAYSAAHPTMPLPSYARVTNLRNAHSMIVRVNDRGPYAPGRIMDVSRGVAEALDFRRTGTALVKVEYIGPASLQGSDDSKLLATLRMDGNPATFDGKGDMPSMVAEAEPRQRVASIEPTAPQPPVPQPQAAPRSDRQSLNNMVEDIETAPAKSFTGTAPIPPLRPFDLGTIPGAGTQISGPRQASAR
jgi:rare lipoprotein A